MKKIEQFFLKIEQFSMKNDPIWVAHLVVLGVIFILILTKFCIGVYNYVGGLVH